MKLAYFVHDLADPAVARRVQMLTAGGADIVVLGFRRSAIAPDMVANVTAIDLGRTYDGRLGHRAILTAIAALSSGRWRRVLAGVDVVMARTLEMAVVADAARRTCGLAGSLVYECLDIHRMMLGRGLKGQILRRIELAVLHRARMLIVSSPAFLEAYFRPMQGVGVAVAIDTLLVENKVLEFGSPSVDPQAPRPAGPPWRIGWMGAIRCRKSLDILTDVAARRPDLVELRIHGRPAHTEFDDFDGQVAAAPGVTFQGPYSAADLPDIYGQVHFSWAVDFMEEGQNSSWLLPNRLYESARYGAIPIALTSVQTGRYLAAHGFGVGLREATELEAFLDRLTPATYAALQSELAAVPSSRFVARKPDALQLVCALLPARNLIREG